MRYILILIGAAGVTYFLIKGVRAFIAERKPLSKPEPEKTNHDSTNSH